MRELRIVPAGHLSTLDSQDLKMPAQPVQRVVLKRTTQMSLNERFAQLRKNQQQPQAMPGKVRASMRQQRMEEQLANARKRRLAQQMGKRPGVQAAFHPGQSLQGRLGERTIQVCLGRPVGALARGANGGRGTDILQRDLPRGGEEDEDEEEDEEE